MGAQGLLANAAIFHNDSVGFGKFSGADRISFASKLSPFFQLLHRLGYRVMAEASHDFVFNSGGRHLFQVSYSRKLLNCSTLLS